MMPPALARALPILPAFRQSFVFTVNFSMGLVIAVYLLLHVDDLRRDRRIHLPYPVAAALTLFAAVGANFAGHSSAWHAFSKLLGNPA